MAKQKFKKGDKIQLKRFPESKGTVKSCRSHMVFVDNGNGGSYAFSHPDNVELSED